MYKILTRILNGSIGPSFVSESQVPPTPGPVASNIYLAAENGDVKQVEAFIKKGAKTDERFQHNNTALHVVKTAEIAEILLKANSDLVKCINIYGQTPLHLAQDPKIAEKLIEKGANVNAKDASKKTRLHENCTVEIADILIQNHALVNMLDNKLRTPLFYQEDKNTIDLLIKHGAEITENIISKWEGQVEESLKCLIKIHMEDRAEIEKETFNFHHQRLLFLLKKLPIANKNNYGKHLIYASFLGLSDVVELLANEKKILINAIYEDPFIKGSQTTALHYAKDIDIATTMVEKCKADPNIKNSSDEKASEFMCSFIGGFKQHIIKYLQARETYDRSPKRLKLSPQ